MCKKVNKIVENNKKLEDTKRLGLENGHFNFGKFSYLIEKSQYQNKGTQLIHKIDMLNYLANLFIGEKLNTFVILLKSVENVKCMERETIGECVA